MSLKVFLNEMSVRQVNILRYLIHVFNYLRGKYKEPVAFFSIRALGLEQETIAVEPLFT